jgi:IPT/TIG domain/Cohesin domain/HYR domain
MKNKIRFGCTAVLTMLTLTFFSTPAMAGGTPPPVRGGIADLRLVKSKIKTNVTATNNTTVRNAEEGSAPTTSGSGTTSGEVSTGINTCDFSGFAQNDLVSNAYSGGTSSLGTTKSNIGIGYAGARVLNSYNGSGEPNSGIVYSDSGSIVISIPSGNKFEFSYTCSTTLTMRTFSSVNGTGTALNEYTISQNVAGPGGPYNAWTNISKDIAATVRSVSISGNSGLWGIDQVVVTSVNPPPTIASISPTYGWQVGGTAFTLTGTNFTGATSVMIGGVAATNLAVLSATQITAVTPSSSTFGAKDVVVTTPAGSFTATTSFTYKADCNNNGIDDATEIAGSIVTRVAGFNGASGDPHSYTENGITFTSGQQHVHLFGSSIYNHGNCCTTPIIITATEPVFTLKSIDVIPGTNTVLVGSNGASVTLSSSGAKNFGSTFQNVTWVRWEESGYGSYFDNVAIEVVVGPSVPDCNLNGIPDSCELADGSAVDQNGNDVPDSCDPFPVLRLTTNASACNAVGSTVTVDATLSGVLNNVVAGQMLLTWDVSKLSFAAVLPGDAPYTTAYALNQQAGTIMILASTTAGGTGTTAASVVVSRIQFTVMGGSCSGTGNEVGFFTFGPMVTEFTDGYGGATLPTLLNSAGFVVDDGAPVLSNGPEDVTVQAEAGMGSFANVALTPPTATDACAPGLTVSSSRSDGEPVGAAFPVGTTTVTWSATDPCANTTTDTTLVTVNNANTGDFEVSYTNSGSYAASSARLLTLNIHGDYVYTLKASQPITLFHGAGTISLTDLAVDNYDCVAIEEKGRSLRRVATMSDAGLIWTSTATLVAGDLINDEVIDVLDWGAYIVGNPNADLDGNSVINTDDGTIIITNFGLRGETGCGTSLMGPPEPISAISVAELVDRGMTDLIGADLNNDGWLDMEDVRLANNYGK